jgi:hypothetical protein
MKNDNVAFLVVTSDDEQPAKAFVKKHNLHLPFYLYRGFPPNDLPVGGVPTTYILDRKGAAKFKSVGAANWDDDGVRAFIRALGTS